jgi:L,D-peptidoglycan transpeptidase YkuD (ErfK/YbiS/YcfS/YnhG family)
MKAMFWISIVSLLLHFNTSTAFKKFGSTQLVVVISSVDTSTTGSLSFFQYDVDKQIWIKVYDSIPVNIGMSGFAWAKGLQNLNITSKIFKHEGDGKSPAGIFYLRNAFGYAPPSQFINISYPYKQVDSTTVCVDDINSLYYNHIITQGKNIEKDWNSAEKMRRDDDLYKWGINIGYNEDPVNKGAGSCIFFHVWRGQNHPTTGCTSMSQENLLKLLKQLDPKSKPIVIQGTREQYLLMKKKYSLP